MSHLISSLLVQARYIAKIASRALNIAIGAQIILGAIITVIAAATTGRRTSIATSILGGLSTLAASYLARSRGSREPETSLRKCNYLEQFIRDCESFLLDHGKNRKCSSPSGVSNSWNSGAWSEPLPVNKKSGFPTISLNLSS